MSRLDLDDALVLRRNGVDISAVRLNGTSLWLKPTDPPGISEYNVWGEMAPVEPTSYNDAGPNAWLSQQFHSTTPTPLEVLGLRLYVPVGSLLIGKTGKIGLMRRTVESGGVYMRNQVPGNEYSTNGSQTTFDTPLVAGWNDVYFNAVYHMGMGDGIMLGYMVDNGTYYLYDATLSNQTILDVNQIGINLAFKGTGAASNESGRCMYNAGWSEASWYGIDIIVGTT